MKRISRISMGLLVAALTLLGCATPPGPSGDGWITLLDGNDLNNWNLYGNANWRLQDGVAQAELGNGHLVSKNSYGDFQLRAEFWVDTTANSGIFIRCGDPKKITAENCYEVNIFDTRPDPSYGTGGIPNFAKTAVPVKAGGKWNTYDITAKGSRLTVVLNGVETVNFNDAKLLKGNITLQYGGGVVKFRKVQIKPL
ncbi:MAG TPA: DUF1080 domain-containing protein [Burkholderiales bacterium]|nr:DUF1080 domain-containing protein [Burkholderiales bacterium]